MDPSQLPVLVVDAGTGETFDELRLNWIPHPGHTLQIGPETYTVLEKRHYYQLRSGKYQLHTVRAFVRPAPQAAQVLNPDGKLSDRERSNINGQWVIGDTTCEFNARSPLVRCAVNPMGPCAGCRDFKPRVAGK